MHEIHFQAAVNYDDALWLAATESGVDSHYWDIFGRQHYARREALQAILVALGWDTSSFDTIESERRNRFEMAFDAGFAKTCVIGENQKFLACSAPEVERASLHYEFVLENGERLTGSVEPDQLKQTALAVSGPRRWRILHFDPPADIPLGYHLLKASVNGRPFCESIVIVCPDRAYLPSELESGGRTAGFNVALYGLRSSRNWGAGDFTDLKTLIDWAAREVGFNFVGLNPLHALHNRTPYNASPYLPLSMYYKNLLYIDIEGVPEFVTSPCARAVRQSPRIAEQIEKLRNSELVEYSAVDRIKRRFLKLLYRRFRHAAAPDRREQFRAFCEREGDQLDKFALYCALDEQLHRQNRNWWTWRDWPASYRSPNSDESKTFGHEHKRLIEYYKYIQFVIDEQLASAQQCALECGMSIGLYHDLAVATDNCGSDLWAYPQHYVTGCRVGAPPDDFSPQGQDWGFPPPNKEAYRAEGYHLFRESIRKIVRHGGALRLDHVMRLYRLFWVPGGMTPADGAYVRDYAIDLMHVLALESVRSHNIIIGEDLGTVTDEMRDLFSRFGILSYSLFPFEKNYQTGEFKRTGEYPRQALVSPSTHDLPTVAGFWAQRDIQARRDAGVLDESGSAHVSAERRREKQRMLDVLHAENLLPGNYTRNADQLDVLDGELHNAIMAFLANVPSMLLLVNQEDYTKESEQQNLPGTTAQYPNWQRKMRIPLEALRSPESEPYNRMIAHHLRRTGRAE